MGVECRDLPSNAMRYGSVCSGIEAATVAWEPLGWKPAFYSEINPFCSDLLTHHYPQVTNHGDFTKLIPLYQAGEGPHIDVLVGGTPCFPGDTRVLTDKGPVPISTLKVGDQVLTHTGRYRSVLAVGSKQAPTIRVKGQGADIITTHEHPFLSRIRMNVWDNDNRTYVRKFGQEEWTDAKDMNDRFWASVNSYPELPIPEVTVEGRETDPAIQFTPEFFWLVGTWVGNGWTRISTRRGYVMLADAHESEEELKNRISAAGLHASSSVMKTATRFQIASRPLARWLESNFGKGAATKTIPAWVLGLPDTLRQSFLDGYLFADGNRTESPDGWQIATTSPDLALTTKCLFWSFGRSVTVQRVVPKRKACIIEGRTVNEAPYFQVRSNDVARSSIELEGKRWGLVRKVEETGKIETVYNIEVADDNTYTAEGIIVHNCQSFSVAGLRAGLSDPRGGLALSFVQLVAAARPRWVCWENVPGSLSSDGGRAFASLVGGLQELGYGVAWRVLDAQYVRVDGLSRAVPQRRRRVFLVGHSAGDVRRPAAVLFEPEGSRGNHPPRRLTRQEVAGGSGAGAAGGSGVVIPEVCGTLSDGAHMGGGLNGQDAFSGRIIPVEPTYPIQDCREMVKKQNGMGLGEAGAPAYTIDTTGAQGVSQGLRVRRLTPLECERLMGFADNYTNITRKAKRGTDGSRYKALGNSMAVNCMRWIGKRIQLVEDTLNHEGG